MVPQHPTQSTGLGSGGPPRSYGAFRPTRTPNFAAPGFTFYRFPGLSHDKPDGSYRRRAPTIILVICSAVILIQTALIIRRSDTLARFIDLESAAFRASKETSALITEREKSERERTEMRHDREFWGKVPDDRVPQGAFWDVIRPAVECRGYGEREYSAMLQSIPEGWSAVGACMNMPAEVEGVTIRRPRRCTFVDGSPYIHGYWMVGNQSDCRPRHEDFHDAGCTSYRSGARRIEAHVVGIIEKKEQDWRLMCEITPLIWNQATYTSPTHCEERRGGRKVAMWDIPDDSCL